MRNLIILTMAGAGAWLMVQTCQSWSAGLQQAGAAGPNPVAGLLFGPALLAGALAGALLGSLLAPFR